MYSDYIKYCIQLAQRAKGCVSPNPMVGALLLDASGNIIGEGYHQKYGEAHAEVNAVKNAESKYPNAEELLAEATLVVTLEPCSHFGKTPPCVDLILEKKIKRVVIGCVDASDKVCGKGIDKLRQNGVELVVGVEEELCKDLNKRFFTAVEKQRPYVVLKWAQCANGFMALADKSRVQISGLVAQRLSHKWRTEEDAILVGKNTALIDNPRLNVRKWEGENPVRVLIDKNLDIDEQFYLRDDTQKTIVFNARKTDKIGNQTSFICLDDFDQYLVQNVLYQLYLMDVQSVIVEGGAQTLNLFVDSGLWDEARVFQSKTTKLIDGLLAPNLRMGEQVQEDLGEDWLKWYSNNDRHV